MLDKYLAADSGLKVSVLRKRSLSTLTLEQERKTEAIWDWAAWELVWVMDLKRSERRDVVHGSPQLYPTWNLPTDMEIESLSARKAAVIDKGGLCVVEG